MGIISVEQADRLYWLGRYTERVYTTLKMYNQGFDHMIDESRDSYPDFCRKMDIPNIYKDKDDFFYRYPYDPENPDSIISNLQRAYDNAIVLRESIGSDTLSYIQLAVYDWNKASLNQAPLMETQKLLDHILAFWGTVDDQIDSQQVRNILKAGKRIERIDLYARMGFPREALVREVHRLMPRIRESGLSYKEKQLQRISVLAEAEVIDNYELVTAVESLQLYRGM